VHLLGEYAVSRLIGRSVSSLRRDRQLRKGIEFVRIGRLVRYDPSSVWEYIKRNVVRVRESAA
jgi:hypothetical protein